MKLKEYIYYLLVNREPDICMSYHWYRKKSQRLGRIKAWLYLLKLNIQYYIFGKRNFNVSELFYAQKTLCDADSESSMSVREAPSELAKKLAGYDIISFDVFDTLIFRPFSSPTDLFFLVGGELKYPNFQQIRIEAEKKAREEKYRRQKNREIKLLDIWNYMETETGIPKERGLALEWKYEQRYCFANTYMLEVLSELKRLGKEAIIISDMYLGKTQIRQLLSDCGFPEFKEYFVSSDYGKSKNEGNLYEEVKQIYGTKKSYVHVGDNPYSDQKQAEKHGIASILYSNVNDRGIKYRAEDMSVICGSMYRGLVNTYIHNGLKKYSLAYEYGFIYGGFFVLGYCRWIHEYVRQNSIDKILFLARDGDILSKVYRLFYKEEGDYVYWSRLAAAKMSADYFRYDYFRRFLYHKTNQGYSLEKVFATMELSDMLDGFLKSKEGHAFREETLLTEKTAEAVKCYLQQNWDKVLAHYKEQTEAGKAYFTKVLAGCKKVVAVDVGWAGSGAVALEHMVNEVWRIDCEIVGLIAGTNTIYSQEPNASEPMLRNGQLVSYMFSQTHNRDIWKTHNPSRGHNILVELLLASQEQSFRKFAADGTYEFSHNPPEIDAAEVQRGILDFAAWWQERMGEIPDISGRDAFAPIEIAMKNEKWFKKIIISENVKMNLE